MVDRDLIARTIKERGWTVKEFADASAIPKTTLDRILNGSTPNPGILTMRDIATALELPLGRLVGLDKEVIDHAETNGDRHDSANAEARLYNRMLLERNARIAEMRRWLSVSVAINAALIIYQMLRWLIDVANPDLGWIRLHDADLRFAGVFLLVIFLSAVIICALWALLRKRRD